jgi:hypothetical protein
MALTPNDINCLEALSFLLGVAVATWGILVRM